MKIAAFFLFGLVALFSATSSQASDSLASAVQEQVEQHGLTCDDAQINNHCAKSDGQVALLGAVCQKLLKAYLCDNKTSEEDLQAVLNEISSQG